MIKSSDTISAPKTVKKVWQSEEKAGSTVATFEPKIETVPKHWSKGITYRTINHSHSSLYKDINTQNFIVIYLQNLQIGYIYINRVNIKPSIIILWISPNYLCLVII